MAKDCQNELAFAKKVMKEIDYNLIILSEKVFEGYIGYEEIKDHLQSIRETLGQFNFGP